jgi:electron transfer flavoprotein beta subunit
MWIDPLAAASRTGGFVAPDSGAGSLKTRCFPMMVVVPVKWVPDTGSEKRIDESDGTVDRDGVESILCPVNEFALEEAVRLKEEMSAEVTALLVGPEPAQQAIRKALSFGLDAGLHISDEGIAGTDALGTARVIAAAVQQLEWDIVIFGNQSTDARTSLVPAAVAELLDVPSLTYARHIEIEGDRITVHREHEEGWDVVTCDLPAVVSVVEAINEPRYPSLKATLSARSKPLEVRSLAGLGLGPEALEPAAQMFQWQTRQPRAGGHLVIDDDSSDAVAQLVEWMAANGFIP